MSKARSPRALVSMTEGMIMSVPLCGSCRALLLIRLMSGRPAGQQVAADRRAPVLAVEQVPKLRCLLPGRGGHHVDFVRDLIVRDLYIFGLGDLAQHERSPEAIVRDGPQFGAHFFLGLADA